MPMAAAAIAGAWASVTAAAATFVSALTFSAGVMAGLSAWTTVASVAALGAALMMKPPGLGSQGQQVNIQMAGPNAAVPLIFGRTGTQGIITYRATYGNNNDILVAEHVLSVGPVAAIESFSVTGRSLTYSGNPHTGMATVTQVQGVDMRKSKLYRYEGLKFAHRIGSLTDTSTLSTITGDNVPWITVADRMPGLARTILRCKLDEKRLNFPEGYPDDPISVVKGVKCYDPRLDSTYPGGDGPHRWDDQSTHEWSENPFIVGLNFIRGWWGPNGTKLFGLGAPRDLIDIASFVSAANVADANDWTVGGQVVSTDGDWTILTNILASGGGVPTDRGGRISCFVRSPKVATFTLNSADVLNSRKVTTTTAMADRFNVVVPSCRQANQKWELIAGEPVTDPSWLEQDGGNVRTEEIAFPLVSNFAQAHQLAAYYACDSREFLEFEVQAKPRALAVDVGDCIEVDLPEFADGQTWIVMGRRWDPATKIVSLILKSETYAKHAFCLGQSQEAPEPPELVDLDYDPTVPPAPPEAEWAITSTSIVSAGGSVVPALVLAGSATDPNAARIIVETRAPVTPDDVWPDGVPDDLTPEDIEFEMSEFGWSLAAEGSRTATQITVAPLAAGTTYDVSVRYERLNGALTERLILGPATTAEDVAGGVRDGGIDWTSNTISNVPPAIQVDENGNLSAAFVAHGSNTVAEIIETVNAGLAQTQSDLSNAIIESNSVLIGALDGANELIAQATAYRDDAQTAAEGAAEERDAALASAQAALANATIAAQASGWAVSNATSAQTFAEQAGANATTANQSAAYAAANAALAQTSQSLSASFAEYAEANATAAEGHASMASAQATIATDQAAYAAANASLAQSSQTLAAAFAGYAEANATAAEGHASTASTQAGIATAQAAYASDNAAIAQSNAALSAVFSGYASANAALADVLRTYAETNATISETQAGYASANAALAETQATLAASYAGEAEANAISAAANATLATTQAGYASANAALASDERVLSADYRSQAVTARDAAEGYRDQAASNAVISTTQATHAAANAASAQSNASLAVAHSGYAQANAAAAAGSASTASTQAGIATAQAGYANANAALASTSATLAASYRDTAIRIARNHDFEHGLTGWTTSGTTPTYAASLDGRSHVVTLPSGASCGVYSTVKVPFDTSRKYRIRGRYHTGAGTGSSEVYIGFRAYDAAGNALTHTPGSYAYVAALGVQQAAGAGWVEYVSGVIVPQSTSPYIFGYPPGTAQIEVLALMNYNWSAIPTALDEIVIEDVTESERAASNATIASTQATYAAANAATATTQASLSTTHSGYAAANASIAQSSAATASSDAAAASTSAILASKVGTAMFSDNPTFTGWVGSLPDNWSIAYNTGSVSWTKDTGDYGRGYAPNITLGVGAIHEWSQAGTTMMAPDSYYVTEIEVEVISGSWDHGGTRLYCYDASWNFLADLSSVVFNSAPDSNGNVHGITPAPGRYTFRKLTAKSPAGARNWHFGFSAGGLFNAGTTQSGNVKILRAGWRAATPAEIAAGVALPALSATVSTIQSTVADLETGYELARFQVAATTGGGAAILSLTSDTYGSVAGLSADKIYFGANTYFDDATDTLRTTIGSSVRVIAMGAAFGTDGQLTEWEGPSSVAFSAMSRSNAYFYRANVSPYFGGSAIPGGQTIGLKSFSGSAGASSVTTTVNNVTASSYIEFDANIDGGSLSADSPQYGTFTFEESTDGSSWATIGTASVTIGSSGLDLGGGVYQAESGSGSAAKVGTKSGNVQYRVTYTRSSGSTYVGGATISATVRVTPPIS